MARHLIHFPRAMKTLRNLRVLLSLPYNLSVTEPRESFVYIGTYTRPNSNGVYAYRFDSNSGKTTSLGLVAEANNASFLVRHPNGRFLYAVSENPAGSVSAFAIECTTAKLKLLNTVPSRGGGPCHLAFDNTGNWLFVANYNVQP